MSIDTHNATLQTILIFQPYSPWNTTTLFLAYTIMFRSIITTIFALWAMTSWTSAFVIPTPSFVLSRTSTTTLQVAIDTSDIKNGLTVELDGEPYKVLSFSIMKQARGAAKTTIKFKNLIRGTTIENTYRSGEKFETAMIERNDAQFTYADEVSVCNVVYIYIFLGWFQCK